MNSRSILGQWDQAARDFVFPMLDNGYIYPADVRMSIYRDATRWLMIIEALGANNPRTSGCDSFQNCLYLFGNALEQKVGTSNENFLFPIDSLPDDPLFEDENDWDVRSQCSALGIRGRRIGIDLSGNALERKEIVLIDESKIDPPALLRSLLPEHRELLLATDEELSARNPHKIPLWLRLDEWHHPDLASSELPSNCETFQLLAHAIEVGRQAVYQPIELPNTAWKNWPDGGTL
jgi:hypothetical protein